HRLEPALLPLALGFAGQARPGQTPAAPAELALIVPMRRVGHGPSRSPECPSRCSAPSPYVADARYATRPGTSTPSLSEHSTASAPCRGGRSELHSDLAGLSSAHARTRRRGQGARPTKRSSAGTHMATHEAAPVPVAHRLCTHAWAYRPRGPCHSDSRQ